MGGSRDDEAPEHDPGVCEGGARARAVVGRQDMDTRRAGEWGVEVSRHGGDPVVWLGLRDEYTYL